MIIPNIKTEKRAIMFINTIRSDTQVRPHENNSGFQLWFGGKMADKNLTAEVLPVSSQYHFNKKAPRSFGGLFC